MPDTPQFNTAQYIPKVAGDTCRACSLPVTGVYYVANGSTLCGSCGEKLRQQIPTDSHAAFVRGILFGLGGFVAGLVLYAGFTILTGIEIGFVSLAVGWLVGKAMMIGSKGVGWKTLPNRCRPADLCRCVNGIRPYRHSLLDHTQAGGNTAK
jgi:hypothetical protein